MAQSGEVNVGVSHFGSTSPGWNLNAGHGWREYTERVNFPTLFGSAPAVMVSLSSFDILHGTAQRLKVRAKDVDAEGFTLSVVTWWDTKVFACGAAWIAHA